MLGRLSLAVLVGVAALGAQMDAAEAARGCRVNITATGAMRLEVVGADAPIPQIKVGAVSSPKFTRTKRPRGNAAKTCDNETVSKGDVTSITPGSVDDRLYRIVLELISRAQPRSGPAYDDFSTLLGAIQSHMILQGFRETLVDTTRKLITKFANPLEKLNGMPIAKDAATRAVNLLVDAYLKGQDPDKALEGNLSKLVDDLAEKTATAAVPKEALQGPAKDYLKKAAAAIKAELIAKKPDTQTVQVIASTDKCEYDLNLEWKPIPGDYTARFNESCGDVNALRMVKVDSVKVLPGKEQSFDVKALSVTGGALPIKSVDKIVGLEKVTGGGNPAIAIAGGVATITFMADKPKFDKPYPVSVTITTGGGRTVRYTATGNGTVTVLNVAPEPIGKVTPPEAKPGEQISLNTEITVRDDNADDEGCRSREVHQKAVMPTGHPKGLKTDRAQLTAFTKVAQKSCDASNGTFVFNVQWSGGTVQKPHEHGTYKTGVTVSDREGATGTSDDMLAFKVEDVPPTATIKPMPKNFFTVDERERTPIHVVGRIQDDNGADDIVSAVLNAKAAGGESYSLPQMAKGKGKDWIEIETPKFKHPGRAGKYPITLAAADEKHKVDPIAKTFIDVSNEKPNISSWGYVYQAGGLGQQRERVCPGQLFNVGVSAGDREGHKLTVKVVIKKDGVIVAGPLPLPHVDGTKNYVMPLTAPKVPGNYTIEFTAVEADTKDKFEAKLRTELLEVVDCTPKKKEELEEWAVDVRVEPRTVCVGDRFETNPIAQVRVKGGEREHRLPDGHAVYGDAMLPFTGGRTTGFVAQGPVGVQSVEMSFDLGGGRMLAHQALVQVIECPGPSQPVAFADYVTTQAADQISSGNSGLADMWAGVCYAALELQPGFVPPQGRDSRAVAEVSQRFAKDAAELAGDLEEQADDALQDYVKRQNKQAEALLDDDAKDARKNAERAADNLSEARGYSNQAAMYRFLEQIFQNHAAGNRLAARSDQTGAVDPRYCADRMAWFASQQPAQQRRPQSDASTQTRNQMLMQGLQGLMNRDRQHHGHPSGHSAQPGIGVQGLFGN